MKKAVFIVATQYDNLGDLIINKCLIDELSKHVILYIDAANVPDKFIKELKTNPRLKFLNEDYGFSFKNITIYKFFTSYSKEFSFLFKSPGPMVYRKKSSFKSKLRSLVFKLIYRKMYSTGVKSYVIGSEITFESQELIPKFLEGNYMWEKFLVRSESNMAYLQSLGVNNAEYIPDLCFLIQEDVKTEKNRNQVGISFRDLEDDDLHANIVNSVREFVSFYLNQGLEVVFFYQVERDKAYTKALYNLFDSNKKISFIDNTILLDDIEIYENFKAVTSNRLHVLLLGFTHNTLTFPLVDDNSSTNKIKGVYSSIGSSSTPLSILTKTDLKEIDDEYQTLVKEMKSINHAQRALCKEKITAIFK